MPLATYLREQRRLKEAGLPPLTDEQRLGLGLGLSLGLGLGLAT